MSTEFALRIAELRKKAGMTMRTLAFLMNSHESIIGCYERGVTRPSPSTLKRMAAIFQVDPGDLTILRGSQIEKSSDKGMGWSDTQDTQFQSRRKIDLKSMNQELWSLIEDPSNQLEFIVRVPGRYVSEFGLNAA